VSLSVDRLAVWAGERQLLAEMTIEVPQKTLLAVLGESGSGKTVFGRALAGLLPPMLRRSGRVKAGPIVYVPQESGGALHPTRTVGSLFQEGGVAAREAESWLHRLGVGSIHRVLTNTGATLSGGEQQRVLLALALSVRPALVVADEPTSALDVSTKGVVRAVLRSVADEGAVVVLITHELSLLQSEVDRCLVLYRGQVVEEGPASQLRRPLHPYTAALMARGLPQPTSLPAAGACVFVGECRFATQVCRTQPPLRDGVACHHPRRP
jgi:ABC-type glutathione transport system ATPase component